MIAKKPATLEDLYRVPDNGKAELVDGELILMSPTGDEVVWAVAESRLYFGPARSNT